MSQSMTIDEMRMLQALRYLWNLRDKKHKVLVRINYTERSKVRDILGKELSNLLDI